MLKERERGGIQDTEVSGLMKAGGDLPGMKLDLGSQLPVKLSCGLGLCTTFSSWPHPTLVAPDCARLVDCVTEEITPF